MTLDRHALAETLVLIARDAGAAIMAHYAHPIEAKYKDDRSPVTIADDAAEAVILPALAKAAADIPVVSEEQFAAGYRATLGERFFLVDPLDGTKEFLSRNGEFTVNIALVENGAPTVGVVYAPAIERLFVGALPDLAYEVSGGARKPMHARRPGPDGLVAVASRSHRDAATDDFLARYKIASLTSAGSSLKFCLVAAGEADLYPRLGTTMEWDTAAGHAVLAAAGGSVTELDGSPLCYGKTAQGLKNPHFVARGLAN